MIIKLNDFVAIKEFIKICESISTDVFLLSIDGKYKIDGKSILGICSLDLTKPVVLKLKNKENYYLFDKFKNIIKENLI